MSAERHAAPGPRRAATALIGVFVLSSAERDPRFSAREARGRAKRAGSEDPPGLARRGEGWNPSRRLELPPRELRLRRDAQDVAAPEPLDPLRDRVEHAAALGPGEPRDDRRQRPRPVREPRPGPG